MKKTLFVIAVLLGLYGGKASAQNYDFSAVSPNGQTLYYKVYSSNIVGLIAPCDTATLWTNVWAGYQKPVGHVIVPDSVQYGGQWFYVYLTYNGAFYGCSSISKITFPRGFQMISNKAFYGCTALSSVNFEDTWLYYIGSEAFRGCTSLQRAILPESGRAFTIDTAAFRGCTRLSVVSIPSKVSKLPQNVFRGASVLDTLYFNAVRCTTDLVTRRITLLDQVMNAENCPVHGLRTRHLVLGDSVATINPYMFSDDADGYNTEYHGNGQPPTYYVRPVRTVSLSITVGYNVQHILDYAFKCIGGLNDTISRHIIFKSAVPPTRSTYAWTYANYDTIYVPCGSATAYASHFNLSGNGLNCIVEASAPTFSALPDDPSHGNVQVLTEPTCTSPIAVVYATANAGYHFVRWNDNNTDNPRTITVTSDATYTAYFEADNPDDPNNPDNPSNGIADVEGEAAVMLYPNPASGAVTVRVEGLEGTAMVQLLDQAGREQSRWTMEGETLSIDLSGVAQGAYFVRITTARSSAIRKLIVR